jgi:DNA-binding response OmpR family regulator
MSGGKVLPALEGARILIVEDEYYLADDLVRALGERGAEVVGPAATLDDAARLVGEGRIDCAILDINLRGKMAFPLAERLRSAGIPFLIATGYGRDAIPEEFRDVPHLQKPIEPARLVDLLPQAMADAGRT